MTKINECGQENGDIEAQRNQNASDVVAHLALDPPQITGFVMCEVQKESDKFCSHRLAELHKLMRNKILSLFQ